MSDEYKRLGQSTLDGISSPVTNPSSPSISTKHKSSNLVIPEFNLSPESSVKGPGKEPFAQVATRKSAPMASSSNRYDVFNYGIDEVFKELDP